MRTITAIALTMAGLAASPRIAPAAEISFVDQFRTSTATQTGDGESVSTTGFGFVTHAFTTGAAESTTVEVEYPGAGSPDTLVPIDSTTFGFASQTFATKQAMDAAFPSGTYTYTADGETADTASVVYGDDHYPAQPFLAGSTYTDLQDLDSQAAFEIHFSTFAEDPGATEQLIFFAIYDAATNARVFDKAFLPRTITGVTLPADTLLPGHAYRYEIIYSNRTSVDSPGAQFNAVLAWERRTSGGFETAAICGGYPVLWPVSEGGNDHFYTLLGEAADFATASTVAAEADAPIAYGNGHLVTITSAAEQAFLEQCFPPRATCAPFQGPCTWTAASDAETEGVWKWTAGPEAGMTFYPSGGYSNWYGGEPNDQNGEDCAIYGWNGTGAWNDIGCSGGSLPLVEWSPARACGDPLPPDLPRASDAQFVLKTAVALEQCPLCICDTDDNGKVSAGDALLTLRFAVGQPVELDCPACGS